MRRLPQVVLALALAALAPPGCDERADDAAPAGDDGPFRPAVQEGLGAAVAILIDNSGSMGDPAEHDDTPKYLVARNAIDEMLGVTEQVIADRPDFPVRVGIYSFAGRNRVVHPMGDYDGAAIRDALAAMSRPRGGTAIGDAMTAAIADLYAAGTFRKYILVVTDGENTDGRHPRDVARDIARRSEGAVEIHFVAFDTDPEKFRFLTEVRGQVLPAAGAAELRRSLDDIYRGRILAEAIDAGESAPPATDTTHDRSHR